MKKTLLTLALTAAGIAAVTVAQAQPVPAPPPGPAAPAPTATTDPNAPPAAPPPVAPAPTATTTAAPTAPPAPGVPGAQPVDPNAPPAPPPPAPPAPPVADPVAPTPAPVYVPPPVAPVAWGAPPPAATPAAPAKKKELSLLDRFAGSQVGWNHSATTTLLGLGGSCSSSVCSEGGTLIGHEEEVYSQTLSFIPAFMIYRGSTHTIRAVSSISMTTELTNGSTSTFREPDVFDIPIRIADTIAVAAWGSSGDGSASSSAGALARDPTLAGAAEYRTQLLLNGGVLLPVSRASRGSGLNLTSTLGVGIRQQIKLLGSSSDYLGNITFTLSERWDHQFWDSFTRVNDDLNRPRMSAGGGSTLSDQLSGGATVENRLIHNLSFFLPVYGDLQLSGLFQVWNDLPFKFQGTDCEVELMTGCVNTPVSDSKLRSTTQFDVSLYYQFSPELGADIGYNNFSGQLGEDGKTRNPFYSPGSIFYADISVFPDQLIKRFTTPKPATQVGSR